jgi:tripartite-type tricarboxylate transporter receptor subunit TctC
MLRRSLLALPFAAPAAALAQDAAFPNRPITIYSGFPNGSGIDIYVRRMIEPLSRCWA